MGANIISTDPNRMRVFQIHCNMLWICPIHVIVVLTLIILRLSWAGAIGCAVILLYVPLQWIILKRQSQLRKVSSQR